MKRTLALLVLALAGLPAPARAAVPVECDFNVTQPGFRVMELDLPFGSNYLATTIGGRSQLASRPTDAHHYWMNGIFIIDRATMQPIVYQLYLGAHNAPGVVVSGYGPEVRMEVPATTGTGQAIARSGLPPGLPPGNYLVVFLWQGNAWESSPAGSIYWHTRVRSAGLNCANVASGSLYSFDQRDFQGQQIHVPGAGIANNLRLDATMPHQFTVGEIVAGTAGGVGSGELIVSDSAHSASTQGLLRPWVSTEPLIRHTAKFQGAQPIVLHAGVSFDLIA